VVGDGSGGEASATVNLGVDAGVYFNQVRADQPVVVNSDGLLRFQVRSSTSLSSLTGSGRIEIMSADELGLGVGDSSYTFDGRISGAGKLVKGGSGTVTLNGDNTLTGETSASLGKLVINGMHVGSKVVVNSLGQLGGNGQLGDLTVFPSTRLAPGASPGRLSANNVVLRPSSNFELEFDGPDAGTGYDQLHVISSASISNSILRMAMNYLPANGQVFKIIDKSGPGPVLGTFANGGEGTIFNLNGFEAVLSYVGGDGNDVTLTVTNRFWEFESAVVTMGNGNGYIDPNECNHLTVFIRNIWPGSGISATNIRLDSDTPGIIITSQEWDSGIIQPGTLLSNAKPIQFRTTPELKCGTWADFSLTLTTGSPLRIPFRIFIPAAGGFFAYNLTGSPQSIPDGGSVTSTIHVSSNFSLLNIDRVLVGVHATHPRVSDLRLRLITPGGRNILLSANRGGNGANYGNGCALTDLTFFSDSAATGIGSGVAPFVGQFRPDQPLAAAQGEPLTGAWQLVAEDTVTGQTGTLECWRLHLVPPFCRDAGGGCEPCGGPVAGALGASQMPARLRLTGQTPSVCGWASPFPGTNAAPGPYRYATHLFTNTGPATCISVLLKNTCANTNSPLMASAYTNFFDPGNLVTNYAGDTALSNALTGQFAFRVASNQVFAVVVNDTQPAASSTCSNYTLEIFGLPCPPPRLDIARDALQDQARLFWSTAYPRHQLERTPVLTTPPVFTPVTNTPVVVAGKYTVTNTTSGAQNHYRLRKP
jgi:autotransporter-associated beta strand protein